MPVNYKIAKKESCVSLSISYLPHIANNYAITTMQRYFEFTKPKGYIPSNSEKLKEALAELNNLKSEISFARQRQARRATHHELTKLAGMQDAIESVLETALAEIEKLDPQAVEIVKIMEELEAREAEDDAWTR